MQASFIWRRGYRYEKKPTTFRVVVEAEQETVDTLLGLPSVKEKHFSFKPLKTPVPMELDGRSYQILFIKKGA